MLFPLWPLFLRQGVWYLSMGMLGLIGLFFAMAIVRLILFIITIFAAPPGLWLYPNLFEDVGFFDSFRPVWAWQEVCYRCCMVLTGCKLITHRLPRMSRQRRRQRRRRRRLSSQQRRLVSRRRRVRLTLHLHKPHLSKQHLQPHQLKPPPPPHLQHPSTQHQKPQAPKQPQ